MEIKFPRVIRHCEKAFSADEVIFIARITSMIDCFVVPPRNDDLFYESVNGSIMDCFYYCIFIIALKMVFDYAQTDVRINF